MNGAEVDENVSHFPTAIAGSLERRLRKDKEAQAVNWIRLTILDARRMIFAALSYVAFAIHIVCDCTEYLWIAARQAKRPEPGSSNISER